MGKAIYVFEVQSKGWIDSLILNLKKAQSNAAVQAVVAVADEEQLAKIKSFLQDKYRTKDLTVSLKEDKNLLGGFVIRIGSDEYDWSIRGRMNRLEQKLTWRWT